VLSDFNYNFGFVVEDIFKLGHTRKSRCFDTKIRTLTLKFFPFYVAICTPLPRQLLRPEVGKSLGISTPTSRQVQMEILVENGCWVNKVRTNFVQLNQNIVKFRLVFPTKDLNAEILSGDFNGHFCGY